MPAKAKSYIVLASEGKSHRTKKELALRKAGEASTLTGETMRERKDVRANEVAHKEFMRLRKLFRKIEKDDAIYQQPINDYCMLHAECMAVGEKVARIENDLADLERKKDEMEAETYFNLRNSLYEKELKFSAELDRKRDKKRAIEDKNLMNIQSALRSIPKKVEDHVNPLAEALRG